MNTIFTAPKILVLTLLMAHGSGANANIENHCELYASKAVEQQQRNLDKQCNLTGPRWSSDKEGQYQWCLTVSPQVTNNENAAREKILKACVQRQADKRVSVARSVAPAQTQTGELGIPDACFDTAGSYSPVQYLLSKKTSYQEEPALYRPILSRNGVISQDFNDDRQSDYVFIEKNKSGKVRMTTCISDEAESTYQRSPTAVKMQEYQVGKDIKNYEVSLSYDKLSVSETTLKQPLGAESKVSVYSFDQDRNSFIMQASNQMIISSDGATGTISKQYDLVNKTYRENLDCNNVPAELRSLCKPYQRGGKLVLPKRLPTLNDVDPVLYRKKIAD